MLVNEAISEILDICGNKTQATRAFSWLKATLREIESRHRWKWLLTDRIINFAQALVFPIAPTNPAFDEIWEPVLLATDKTATSSWTAPAAPWNDYEYNLLYSHKGDYWTSNFGMEFNTKWSSGVVWLKYYRKITIPTTLTDTIDLPEEFVFDLIVNGSAKRGLIREDDYDRRKYTENDFEMTLERMRQKYDRLKIANGISMLKEHGLSIEENEGLWPPNYADEL